jgi:hypothetical protein
MASMKIFKPGCQRSGCKGRATFEIKSDDGKSEGIFCGAHAKSALWDVTKAESEAPAATQTPKAVRS